MVLSRGAGGPLRTVTKKETTKATGQIMSRGMGTKDHLRGEQLPKSTGGVVGETTSF